MSFFTKCSPEHVIKILCSIFGEISETSRQTSLTRIDGIDSFKQIPDDTECCSLIGSGLLRSSCHQPICHCYVNKFNPCEGSKEVSQLNLTGRNTTEEIEYDGEMWEISEEKW